MSFTFENLNVYKKAVGFVRRIEILNKSLKGKVSYSILDQMTRAAISIPLNIAEGNGRWHKNDKKRFFWIARGSVFEIVPIIQVIFESDNITGADHRELYNELDVMAKMLTALIKAVGGFSQEPSN